MRLAGGCLTPNRHGAGFVAGGDPRWQDGPMAATTSIRKVMRGLYDPDARARWTAVREIGAYAEGEASDDKVRRLLQRLVWSLNDESGAVGWGAPAAIGEILARRPGFQPEFAGLFPQWLANEDVVLDNAILDAGAIWALGRLGPGAPIHHDDPAALLRPFLERGAAAVRGAAAWSAGRLGLDVLVPGLEPLRDDPGPVALLVGSEVRDCTVADLTREALGRLG